MTLPDLRHVDLVRYYALAAEILGNEPIDLIKSGHPEQAESALNAPAGEFGGVRFYPDIIDQAAVLVCHLTWNHPLAEGSKRAAWASLTAFIEMNPDRLMWQSSPDTIQSVDLMVEIAVHNINERQVADWLRGRLYAINECTECGEVYQWTPGQGADHSHE